MNRLLKVVALVLAGPTWSIAHAQEADLPIFGTLAEDPIEAPGSLPLTVTRAENLQIEDGEGEVEPKSIQPMNWSIGECRFQIVANPVMVSVYRRSGGGKLVRVKKDLGAGSQIRAGETLYVAFSTEVRAELPVMADRDACVDEVSEPKSLGKLSVGRASVRLKGENGGYVDGRPVSKAIDRKARIAFDEELAFVMKAGFAIRMSSAIYELKVPEQGTYLLDIDSGIEIRP